MYFKVPFLVNLISNQVGKDEKNKEKHPPPKVLFMLRERADILDTKVSP